MPLPDSRTPRAVSLDEPWIIRQSGAAPAGLAHLETIFAQANGYLGIRGALDQGSPPETSSQPHLLVQGVYDQQPGRYETDELVSLPDWLPIELWLGQVRLGSPQARTISSQRWLDLRDGLLAHQLELELDSGVRVKLSLERFASLADPHLLAWRMTIQVSADLECRLGWGFDADPPSQGTVHFETVDQGPWGDSGLHHTVRTLQSGITVAQAQIAQLYQNAQPAQPLLSRTATVGQRLQCEWEFACSAQQTVAIERLNAVHTSRDPLPGKPLERARHNASSSITKGFAALAQESRAAWDWKWAIADVEIEGDPLAQNALRYCISQLIQANAESDDRVAIAAKGLTGHGYRGHFFWDTEMFMEPFFVHTNPPAARNLVVYRHRTLPEARQYAEAIGCRGARFPWEATLTGCEQCPTWIKTADGEHRIVTGEQEHHISADVAYGAWYYYQATGDQNFWLHHGLELMIATARFWQSRAEWDAQQQRYVIRRVMGPDEHHDMVDNNAYTNYMAAWNLQTAAAEIDKHRHRRAVAQLLRTLGLSAQEPAAWRQIADKLYLPLAASGIIPQHDGFLQTTTESPVNKPIKQADVLMLLRLWPEAFSEKVQQVNWDFYEPLTDHESSLSPSVHSLVAARLGHLRQARDYFDMSAMTDLANVYGNTHQGLHMAAMGGTWLAVVAGFGGLQIARDGSVHLEPRLPSEWQALCYRAWIRGGILEVQITEGELLAHYDHPGDQSLSIVVLGQQTLLSSGTRHRFALNQP